MRILVPLLSLVLALGLFGCNDDAPMSPAPKGSDTGLAGVWEGTVGEGTLRLEFTENEDKTLTGHVTLLIDGQPETLSVVTIGWTSPTTFSLLLPCDPGCVRLMRGTLDGDTISGKYEHGPTAGDPNETLDFEAERVRSISGLPVGR